MDTNQARIIELLREVHLIAFKEIQRLNMLIIELETQNIQSAAEVVVERPSTQPTLPDDKLMNDAQVAKYLNVSLASVRRWRTSRTGPKFVKIGFLVRYRRQDVVTWLDSCPGGV